MERGTDKGASGGIAMGLIMEGERVQILSDIQGMEDFLGDMDFKVAGTTKGITAIQMDIKIAGIGKEILQKALEQARRGRLYILDKILQVMSEPRKELSPYAPKIIRTLVDPDKIRDTQDRRKDQTGLLTKPVSDRHRGRWEGVHYVLAWNPEKVP